MNVSRRRLVPQREMFWMTGMRERVRELKTPEHWKEALLVMLWGAAVGLIPLGFITSPKCAWACQRRQRCHNSVLPRPSQGEMPSPERMVPMPSRSPPQPPWCCH